MKPNAKIEKLTILTPISILKVLTYLNKNAQLCTYTVYNLCKYAHVLIITILKVNALPIFGDLKLIHVDNRWLCSAPLWIVL